MSLCFGLFALLAVTQWHGSASDKEKNCWLHSTLVTRLLWLHWVCHWRVLKFSTSSLTHTSSSFAFPFNFSVDIVHCDSRVSKNVQVDGIKEPHCSRQSWRCWHLLAFSCKNLGRILAEMGLDISVSDLGCTSTSVISKPQCKRPRKCQVVQHVSPMKFNRSSAPSLSIFGESPSHGLPTQEFFDQSRLLGTHQTNMFP